MKKIKILINLFLCICTFSCFCFTYDSIDGLRSTFTIQDNILTTAAGEKYPRHPFESKLHFDLAYYMKDLKASDIVYKAYKNHILPIVVKMLEDGTSNAANEAFSKALIEICVLFGNSKYSPEKSFIYALLDQSTYGAKWVNEHLNEIRSFIAEANTSIYFLPEKKKTSILKVVIVTTTISGGNHSVAESIANHLEKNKNIQAILIDVEDIAKEVDPLMIATHICTYDKTYSSIFQITNDYSALIDRKILNREVQQYIPSVLLAKLKQKIADLNPDLIISTRSYTSDDLALASLGVPLRLFHPDFELCPSLCSYYRSVPPDSIKFWLPALCPSMFKPLFKKYNKLDMYNENDNENCLLNKLSNILNVPLNTFKEQFEVLGYPCANFYRISEQHLRNNLRQKWDINENDIPVFIVMGKHGTKSLKEIFNQLLHVKSTLPLKYLFICGNNSDLQKELKEKLEHSKLEEKKIVIHGLLTQSEMNEIMNISEIGISKAGGATIIESLMTRRPLLLMHSYPWEELNASYLIQAGLATSYDSTKPLIEQIENYIRKNNVCLQERDKVENWREHLDFYIEPFIKKICTHD